MKYLLETILTINHDDINSQQSFYTMLYTLDKLREVGQDATIYDKELKMYFEDRSARAAVYEIEIENIYLDLDKSIVKASDFIRRTFYRYDWMQLRVNRQGKVLAVENSTDAVKQWNEIRTLILEDYKGRISVNYVDKIDAQMKEGDFSVNPLAQYFYFGLIFPAIPANHSAEWQRSRIVGLCDFDDVRFNELISCKRTTDSKLREYSVSGELVDAESCKLKSYSGHIIMPCDDIHPIEAQTEVSYNNGDVDINWIFKLTQL